jgi:P27 family predicted phage terminase small subunit
LRRGPAPKPTAVKQLAGNPGHRLLNESEPKPAIPKQVPYAPRHLNVDGKREWRKLVPRLMRLGLYTELDQYAVSMLCEVWGQWVEAKRMTRKTGGPILKATDTGNLYQNPWYHVQNKAWEQLRKIIGEFGLTPSSRSKITLTSEEDEPSLAELLFNSIGLDVVDGGDGV